MDSGKVLIWLLVFGIVFQSSYSLLTKRNRQFKTKLYLNILYFGVADAILITFLYGDIISILQISVTSLFALLLFLLLTLWTTNYINERFPIKKKILERSDIPFFFNFTKLFVINKTLDIIFQQAMVLWLVVIFINSGISYPQIVFSFGVIFFIFHIFTIFRHKEFSLFFILSSLVGGFLLPYLVLYHSIEFPYLIVIHLSTYIVGRVVYGYLLIEGWKGGSQ